MSTKLIDLRSNTMRNGTIVEKNIEYYYLYHIWD